MAARLTHEGATADPDEWKFAPDEAELVRISIEDEPVSVKRRDVMGLLASRLFITAWREWARFRRFGLAHGGGPNQERSRYIRVIEVMEQELEAYQSDEMEKHRGGR